MLKIDFYSVPQTLNLITLCLIGTFMGSCGKSPYLPDNNKIVLSNQNQGENVSHNQHKLSVGTNLGRISYWSSQLPFIDHFQSSNKWITQCQKSESGCQGKWNTNEYELLNLDQNGWVKSLPSPQDSPEYTRVSTIMFRNMTDKFPGGKYIVLYDGEGTIEYGFAATKIISESRLGRNVIQVDETKKGGILLTITETDPNKTGNYIRNIKVVEAKQESLFNQGEIFNPLFLEKTKPFSTLRFMDWMKTNNSIEQEWQNRPKIGDNSYFLKGVPIKIMVALANNLEKDAWFNMPHQGTDEYMTNFAQLVKKNLDRDRKIYVEFSNEVWNWQFQQAKYAMTQAKQKWGKEGNARMNWYGMRTAQMCDIWKDIFAEQKDRVNCVISTQTAYKGLEKGALDCPLWVAEGNKPCYQYGISIYAITGYFGSSLGHKDNKSIVKSWLNQPDGGFQSAFQQLQKGGLLPEDKKQSSLKDTHENFVDHHQIAKERSLQLVAYEGGQHIVGRGKVKSDEQLNDFFIELNRNPQMYKLYKELLNGWQESGGGLFMHFSDIGQPSKHGSWGALEYLNQSMSPKYNALTDFIEENQNKSD